MSKGFLGFACGVFAGAALVMAYLHRDVITAAVTGKELPEAPEGCPFSKAETEAEGIAAEAADAVEEAVAETTDAAEEAVAEVADAAKEAVAEATDTETE